MKVFNNKLRKEVKLNFIENNSPNSFDKKDNFFSLEEDIYYRECLPYSKSKNKNKDVFYKK